MSRIALKTARYAVQAALCASVGMGVLWAGVASADVFKFTDDKGNVQYTDRPLKLPAERLSIQSQRTDVVELDARVAADTKATDAREAERKKTETAVAEKKKAADANAAGKVEACNKAREDYRVRSVNFRLFETQPNGERRYLNSAEIDATRDASKKAMEDLCAGL